VSTFWVVCAALALAVVGVLAVPLLRRTASIPVQEQERSNVALFQDQLTELVRDREQGVISEPQFEQARVELSQRLLADVDPKSPAQPVHAPPAAAWRYALLACVPVAAVGAYLVLGTPQAIDRSLLAAPGMPTEHAQKLGTLVQRLAARLETNPDDAEAWVLLARSLQLLGRAPESAKAYARVVTLVPDSAELYADYADVLVTAADGDWTPAATAAIGKAFALDPSHPKTLWLAGTEAYARKDYNAALAHWEKLAPMAEPGSEVARIIQQNIEEVRTLAAASRPQPQPLSRGERGETSASASPAANTQTQPKPTVDESKTIASPQAQPKPTVEESRAAASPQAQSKSVADGSKAAASAVSGTVVLAPALAGEVEPTDTVFIFARAAVGPKMPLAIRRVRVQDLPYRFMLDDSAAMAPGMTISAFPEVVIGARISRSGEATPKPGDLQGISAPIKPGASGIEVRIDARVK
jgi:cytochrome c-type biogenesis protein CcmH